MEPSYLNSPQFFLIAGPCVVESEELCLEIGGRLKTMCEELGIPYIFKASYRKANRTSLNSYTGPGDVEGLELIQKVGKQLGVPTLTDVHSAEECALAAEYVDVLQIPAFLCRQTDLLLAAGKTGKWVNIKKAQFLNGDAMKFAAEKVKSTGNDRIWLTERGNMYGYGDMVVDFRNITEMKKHGFPVVMDVTHSVQQPNNGSGVTGGKPEMIGTIARAAAAVGVQGFFLETHPNPSAALSDGANMVPLEEVRGLLEQLLAIHRAASR
jgi:2-dehydro-3-deoxyphosphooctonate aldolase (KDO 8-P synthase)